MAHEVKTALITGAATVLAAVVTAGTTLAIAYWHIGVKDDTRPPEQRGVFATIAVGQQIVNKLTDPAVPLSQVLPQAKPVQQVNLPRPELSEKQPPTTDPFITDPVTLAACIGTQPLKVQRLRIDPDAKGYGITVELLNGADAQISVWEEGNPTLKNDAGDVLPPGRTNVPMTNYYTFVSEDQAALARAFNDGLSASVNEVVPFHFTFGQGESLHPATAISFEGNFRFVQKDSVGRYTVLKRSLSCSGVPVKRLNGSS